jgi:hypothetical protein
MISWNLLRSPQLTVSVHNLVGCGSRCAGGRVLGSSAEMALDRPKAFMIHSSPLAERLGIALMDSLRQTATMGEPNCDNGSLRNSKAFKFALVTLGCHMGAVYNPHLLNLFSFSRNSCKTRNKRPTSFNTLLSAALSPLFRCERRRTASE